MKSNGSSRLLQLSIIVGIILIVAVIAIPTLLRYQQAAQESSAVAQIRAINTAQALYGSSAGSRYGNILQLISAGVLDSSFANSVSGYNFAVSASSSDYIVTATPRSIGSGRYGYYSTLDAVIHYQTVPTASCNPCFPIGKSGNPVQ